MEPRISMSIVIFVLVTVAQSFPILEEHKEIALPQLSGHEELHLPDEGFDEAHQKFATSYQSFLLESKNPVPLIIKKEFPAVMVHSPAYHGLQAFFEDQPDFFGTHKYGILK